MEMKIPHYHSTFTVDKDIVVSDSPNFGGGRVSHVSNRLIPVASALAPDADVEL